MSFLQITFAITSRTDVKYFQSSIIGNTSSYKTTSQNDGQ